MPERMDVPPDSQRHAAGDMTDAESQVWFSELQRRKAAGEPLDGGKPGPGNPRGGPYQDGNPSEHRFQPRVLNSKICGYPGCNSPEELHDDSGAGPPGEEEEEARGPAGPKMPRPEDLPSYTIWGQFLKGFSR